MAWITTPVDLLVRLPKIAAGVVAVLGATGVLLAIARRDIRGIAVPVEVLARLTGTIAVIVSVAWGPVVLAAPWVALAALWRTGRRHALSGGMPGWAATAADADVDVSIDETTIARALEALRITQITAYLKEGLPLQYLVPCRVDGRGTHAVIRLPAGVTAERIARRRADLATGLYRQAKEVWPTTGDEAGILDLWIADKGALAEGAGPYPMLEAGFTDVFKGVPFGKTLRGDPVRAPMMGRNTITGGMPEQGKSSAARVIMCGAALDITAELRIYIPDTNYDFEVMRPRCSRYVMGADDESIRQIRDDLRDLNAEVQQRGELLVEHGVPEVTRELASAGIGLHPLFVLLEEAHVAIQHPEYGKEISALLVNGVKLGRKRAIHLIVSTQAPVRGSMPPDVTRNCTNGIAFAVGDNYANDALLGAGAYAAGHRATELIPGTDRGTALVKGFTGQRSEVVQVHFVSVARDNDQVTPIIGRALAELARRGRAVPGTGRARRAIQSRDLLADLDAVLGDERVRLADVPALLRDLAPGWTAYHSLTATGLRDLLDAEGVRVTNTGNVLRLDPADLRRVLADRE
jgi:S-DNA-T family DNA segregation ATPase FtsK/SpoIIIE